MSKPRVPTLASRVSMADASRVKPLNPDAWREGKTAHQMGYDSKWRKQRALFLSRFPLCITCQAEGRVTAANVVDHVKPHRGDMNLFWDQKNWQPMCSSCHSRKTALEDGGIGHARRG